MLPDLERLIQLQELENTVEDARRTIAEMPSKREALEARLTMRQESLAAAQQQLADNQAARKTIERDLAVVQARLAKFKDQLMEVKTNREYQAMQKEIAGAEHEVRSLEDRILERLLEADDLTAAVRQTETDLAADQAASAQERRALDQARDALERELARSAEARARLVNAIEPRAVALFEHVARLRRGVAVAEVRGGHCSFCHVRLRPQVANDVRRNDSLIQCESCARILYFAAAAVADPQSHVQRAEQ